MRDFLKMMRQYVSPYKGYMGGAVVLNILLNAVFIFGLFGLPAMGAEGIEKK